MTQFCKTALVVLSILSILLVQSVPAFAQDAGLGMRGDPPMKNIFHNVLWGSVAGGMGMMGVATMDDSKTSAERNSVSNLSTQFITGATYGGLLGLAAGVYFSMAGVSFDSNRSRISFFQPQALPKVQLAGRNHAFSFKNLSLVDYSLQF